MMKSKFIAALSILIGTSIGAGYLGIPYVVGQSGFFPGLFYLIFIAIFMFFVFLYLGEISLRTKKTCQLTGYAQKYLGKGGKILMFFAMLFGIFSALVAYLFGEGKNLSYFIMGTEKYALGFSLLFWLLMAGLTYIGLRALKKYEKIMVSFILVIVLIVIFVFAKGINIENLAYIDKENLFLPFGVILFSFLAFSAMPEIKRVLSGQENLMIKVVSVGLIIPFLAYILFTFVIVGNFGQNVPEIATLALGRFFSILGILTMFTAFFALSLAIRDMFRFDFNLGRFNGWLLSIFVPLVLFLIIYFFKLASFIQILAVAGVVSGGLTGILILLMNKNAKRLGDRKPEYSVKINWFIILLMSVIFIAAILAQFLL